MNDFEEIFTENQINELNLLINRHELSTTNQFAIITVSSIEPYIDFNEFTIDLANYWGIGHKDHKNGVIIAFSTKLKKVRIQNGIGIENSLTDSETMEIIDNILVPEFKNKNYFSGVKNGLVEVIRNLDQEMNIKVSNKN